MTIFRRRPQTVVLNDQREEDDLMWRAVRLEPNGGLTILGHDVGYVVQECLGGREYEFTRRFSKQETTRLRQLLGVRRRKELLPTILERFPSSTELEQFARGHGIAGTFWNRIGD
jgi:hypothetical protein